MSRKRHSDPAPTLHTTAKLQGPDCDIFDEIICKDEWYLNSIGSFLSGEVSVNQTYQNVKYYHYRDTKDPPNIKYTTQSM